MSRRLFKKPQVELDLIDHYASIARDKTEPADRFLRVAEENFKRLVTEPLLGHAWHSPLPSLAGIRVFPLPAPFQNYLVFYRPVEKGIEVLTVLHGSRDFQTVVTRLLSDR